MIEPSYFFTITKMKNLTFIHCKISGYLNLPSESSASCVNCYVSDPTSKDRTSSNFDFTNSIVRSYYLGNIYTSSFTNCFLYSDWDGYDGLDPSNSAFYCLGKHTKQNYIFVNIPNATNSILKNDLNTVFKTYTGSYNDNETFELTDEAKEKYLGSDKTEIGIHGGCLPFDPTPTNPQITKCNVAAKSTADGKLSVDIEVSAAE